MTTLNALEIANQRVDAIISTFATLPVGMRSMVIARLLTEHIECTIIEDKEP